MSQVPSNAALLAATIDYLEAQLLPALEGEHRFKTRLAVNALKALQRGQQVPAGGDDAAADVSSLDTDQARSELLALKILKQEVALYDAQTLAQIEQMLRKSLAINNPKWLNN